MSASTSVAGSERPARRYWVISGIDGYGDAACVGPCFAAELPDVFRSTPWDGKPHITALNAPDFPPIRVSMRRPARMRE